MYSAILQKLNSSDYYVRRDFFFRCLCKNTKIAY